MSAEQQTAVLQEVLDQAYLHRLNTALKNGIGTPPPIRNIIKDPPPPVPADSSATTSTTTTSDTSVSTQQTAPAASQPEVPQSAILPGSSLAAKLGIVGGGLTALTAAGFLGHALLTPNNQPSLPNAPPPAIKQPADGDLIQWLKTHGYNLPGKDG